MNEILVVKIPVKRLEYALWGEAGDYVRNLIKSEW